MKHITRDFQGWPVSMHTLKEILLALGFKENGKQIYLPKNKKNLRLLEAYPRLLEDDGMAYGVNEQYIIEADNDVYDAEIVGEKIDVFNIFRERVIESEVLKIREEDKQFEEELKKWEEEKKKNEPKQ